MNDLVAFAGGFVMSALAFAFYLGKREEKFAAKLDAQKTMIDGVGRKQGRMCAMLVRWADSEEKRRQVADVMEGK